MSPRSGKQRYDAVILGAGVIGLSIALNLNKRGLRVAIIARDLPEDTSSTEFASPWAGCNWYPFDSTGDTPSSKREILTFPYLQKLAKSNPELCERIPFYSIWDEPKPKAEEEIWFRDVVGDYEKLDSGIPGGKANGRTWSSFILHAPKYIAFLGAELRTAGVPIIRQTVSSLDEAYGSTDLVINALGLGAKWLKGVEDLKVYPARGQTVLVKAEAWKKVCVMHVEGFNPGPGKSLPEPAYIIPRPGPDSNFILGGTYLIGNSDTSPDPKTAERILRECSALMNGISNTGPDTKLEIISHNVGLRPAREGGARVELERRKVNGRSVGVVHAYGFGSAGYQQSWGAAEQVAGLVDQYLARSRASL